MTALFAATYPERAVGLVLYSSVARVVSAPDYPWGSGRKRREMELGPHAAYSSSSICARAVASRG